MIIVYGTRFWGRADAVEGLGHVSCRFVHIMFVPLIPIESVFVLDNGRGMKMPFSFKAAMSGWLRGGALIAGIGLLIAAIANFAEGQPLLGLVSGVVGALALGSFPLWGLVFGHCSHDRKAELMRMMGIEVPGPTPMVFNQQPMAPAMGPMQPAGGFGAPNMYGAPVFQQGQPANQYNAPAQSYTGPTAQPYNAPPQQQQAVGYGGPPPGWDPNRR